ncbi:hypothetical protein [Leeia oryzae]|uniref:hypothetical protein n=1 Tax=Leeia oryzae TaxID=356662 RepID=UPI0003797F48|nr:hypothetical protein [Leeia oryzae]
MAIALGMETSSESAKHQAVFGTGNIMANGHQPPGIAALRQAYCISFTGLAAQMADAFSGLAIYCVMLL